MTMMMMMFLYNGYDDSDDDDDNGVHEATSARNSSVVCEYIKSDVSCGVYFE